MIENTQRTALLVMDIEMGILGSMADVTQVVANAAKAIAKARENKVPVIFVVVGFRQGAPEISMKNKSFGAGKQMFAGADMNEFTKLHPDLTPKDGELTVVKRRFSAFTGSDLEVVLRAFDIKHLVLAGVSTSGVVLSTTREAADKDFQITILADCCADKDEEVHRVLTTKVFPRQADVVTVDEWE